MAFNFYEKDPWFESHCRQKYFFTYFQIFNPRLPTQVELGGWHDIEVPYLFRGEGDFFSFFKRGGVYLMLGWGE